MWSNDKRLVDVTRVLCPVDFSDCSSRALDDVVAIARWFGAEIEVLHVVPEPLVTGRAAIQTPLDMGVRGRGAIDRLLLGSVTDRIVRAAMCPVVTVRQG
jgi:nucleotide-binding universal stress UspA family protein